MGLVEEVLVVWNGMSWTEVCSLSLALFTLFYGTFRLDDYIRLKRTGGEMAPKRTGILPFGLDLVFTTILAAAQNRNHEVWADAFEYVRSHTVEFRVLGQRVIFTEEPENIKAILATQFGDYGKGQTFHAEWKEFLNDSIFTTDGAKWQSSRQLLRPQFVKDRVSDLEIFEQHLDVLFTAMAAGGDAAAAAAAWEAKCSNRKLYNDVYYITGRPVDMCDLFYRYTLDVATDFLLGKDTESLITTKQDFALAFNEVQHIQGLITRVGPASSAIPRGKYRKAIRVLEKYTQPFIDKALALPAEELDKNSATSGGEGGRYTFLHELARFTRDPQVLRDQIFAVLLAGRDTTAGTLSWTFYELARHPAVVEKLREEIREWVGVEGDPSGKEVSLPTYQQLKSMKYLQHVISETLRLYPAVPFNVRIALKDCTLPRGGGPDGTLPVAVREGTRIGYSTLLMQRRPDLYPPHLPGSMEFCPERWDHWQPKPWQYIPFNGGPRICLGQQFALTEMSYVIVRFFQRFERIVSHMENVDGGEPTLRADIVLQPNDGVKVSFYGPNRVY